MRDVTFLTSRRRGGFILALTLLIGVMAAVLVIVFQQSVAQEYKGTSRLVRAVKAEAIAESAIAKISAILNSDRWEERYYLRHVLRVSQESGNAPAPEMPFSNRTFPFFEKGPEYESGIASFVGTIGDAPRGRQRARVRILVELQGAEFLFIYDLQYSHGLLGPLNRDPVVQRTLVLADVPPDAINATVDAVWDEAEAAKQSPGDPADAGLVEAMRAPPPEADVLTSLEAPEPPPADFFWPDTPDQDIMAVADGVEERLESLETMDLSQVEVDLQQPAEAGGFPGDENPAVNGFAPEGDTQTQTGETDWGADPATSQGPEDPTLPRDTGSSADPQTNGNGDPQTGDPQTGDPQTGDPQTGDPQTGDPTSTPDGDARTGEPQAEPQTPEQQAEPQTPEPQTPEPADGGAPAGGDAPIDV